MSTTDVMRTLLAQAQIVAAQAALSAQQAQTAAQSIAGLAPLNSPAFTGAPTAPTPTPNDNSGKVATTSYIDRLLGVANGIATLGADGKLPASQLPPISVTSVSVVASQAAMLALTGISIGAIAIRADIGNAEFILTAAPASTLANWTQIGTSPVLSVAGLTGAILASDLMTALAAAPLASPALTGTPTAPTAASGTATTQIATTGFVDTYFAKKASPTFTGTPGAPTATIDTNTGQIATCAFVLGQLSQSGDGTPAMDGIANRGTSTHGARADHVHPTDTSLAPLASPVFTGNPQAPTPATNDNSTSLATTAMVQAAIAASGAGPTTGDVKPTLKTTADSGWVMLNDGSIGNGSSNATTRANADTSALFALLWNNVSNTNCPVQDSSGTPVSRGANAAADFAANRRIVMPKVLGRALASAGAGSGLTSRALGSTFGEETHALTTGEQANMPVTGTCGVYSDGGLLSFPSVSNIVQATAPLSITGTATGGGTTGAGHNTMQPSSFINWMVKL